MIRYPDAWSYSAWADYKLCPYKYHGKKVLKLPEEQTEALISGNIFHKEVAAYVTLPNAPLPSRPIHARILPVVEQLRGMEDKTVEQQWAFTRSWQSTGWFSKQPGKATWLRVVLDAGVVYPDKTAHVIDWKTGKRYDSNDEQMEIFALSMFKHSPWVEEVETRLEYVDNGAEEVAEFKAKDVPLLTAKWEQNAELMLTDRTWTPKPNDKCFFCNRARQNGGDCKFG